VRGISERRREIAAYLFGGNMEIVKHPFWTASTPSGEKLKYVKSILQKAIRRGKEHAAVWAINEMYMGRRMGMFNCDIWRSLIVIGLEDIGPAYRPLMRELRDLKWAQEYVERPITTGGVTVHADRLAFIQAVLLMCRCKKSRAVNEAYVYVENLPPTQEELDAIYNLPDLAKDDPQFFDDCKDMHTDEGAVLGRGLDHFLERGAILEDRAENLGLEVDGKHVKRMLSKDEKFEFEYE
jgi:hypothetical protein